MTTTTRLDVTEEQAQIVRDVLDELLPGREVWAFGSRATGRARPYSDLDLLVVADEPLGLATMGALAEAFTESDLPWKVDVVDSTGLSTELWREVRRDQALLRPSSRPQRGA